MSSLRFQAIEALASGEEKKIHGYEKKITAIFGTNVFSGRTIRE
jgi:glutamine synthetase